jgi:hypothetical protein
MTDPEKRKLVSGNCGEHLWARVIMDEAVLKGEKILVYSGMHHAFTKYKQPLVDNDNFMGFNDQRVGNFTFNDIGDRTITILLHTVWASVKGYEFMPYVPAADGAVDRSMAATNHPIIGFDIIGTPFERTTGITSIYSRGYNDFSLATICDGYIYLRPLAQFTGVTPISDFINNENIELARSHSPNLQFRRASIEQFNRSIVECTRLNKLIPSVF